jgi:hypothetical protein
MKINADVTFDDYGQMLVLLPSIMIVRDNQGITAGVIWLVFTLTINFNIFHINK